MTMYNNIFYDGYFKSNVISRQWNDKQGRFYVKHVKRKIYFNKKYNLYFTRLFNKILEVYPASYYLFDPVGYMGDFKKGIIKKTITA